MQLIKLSYIAHGFSLAINRRPLLSESVEAWRYGPVVPSLYRKLKSYGSGPVDKPISPAFRSLRAETLADDDAALIDAVYAKYGPLSGLQLSYLTHKKGTPWERAYRPDEYGIDLDDEDIRRHYEDLLRGV
ncbi:Panacea domain-containing protein [Sphingomonas caeni]|uniref:Panacea domain-containing protein n=1 Tax=Sphingomonas caeni TaxID=2984949 RepID=UPI00222EAB32|nr:type II toxin-antitoxin system antitoxin SocA domain-containing protein [Sphingomonas caeni]